MKHRTPLIIISLFILIILVGGIYAYLLMNGSGKTIPTNPGNNSNNPGGFVPLNTTQDPILPAGTSTQETPSTPEPTNSIIQGNIPSLRLLSNTPVGGYGASTTGATTTVRWIDRGRGNIYEVKEGQNDTVTLSNTILPRVYESIWNKNLTAFIGSILLEKSTVPTVIYSELKKQTFSTTSTPYILKGKNISDAVIGFAISPNGDKTFLLINENGNGVGYTANFDGTKMTRIFDTPLTQVNVEWPEANTIAITTKGLSSQPGFLYFVSPKTGIWRSIVGPIFGLSTRTSHDAKYVIVSSTGNDSNVNTALYSVAKNTFSDAVVRTLADKCTWGNFYKELVYCAVPAQPTNAVYPDDWYRGTLSLVDKIWQINASTNEIHLLSSIIDQSDRVIDVFNIGTDPKDTYLYFMNKRDLSLWSLDLVASH